MGLRSCRTVAMSAGRIVSRLATSDSADWSAAGRERPPISDQSMTKRSPRRKPPPPRRTNNWVMYQSVVRLCSTATSRMATRSPVSRRATERSKSSAVTRVSPARCSNRRRFTVPVTMTCPVSMAVTFVIGTKMRRRGCTSTTRPVSLGGFDPERRTTMPSRTLPT